ncbi:MAG: alkyl sulfatase C-terminal domain-containing protein, partial [Sphingomonadaceae bacterium]
DPKRAGAGDDRVMLTLPGQAPGQSDNWLIELRNSTLKSSRGAPAGAPAVTLDKAALGELVAGAATVDDLAKRGAIKGDGIPALARIFGALDLAATPISLVVR